MVLYVRLLNYLYGIIQDAFLYHKKFVKDLKSIGFVLNIYDPFVPKNIVQDKNSLLSGMWMTSRSSI